MDQNPVQHIFDEDEKKIFYCTVHNKENSPPNFVLCSNSDITMNTWDKKQKKYILKSYFMEFPNIKFIFWYCWQIWIKLFDFQKMNLFLSSRLQHFWLPNFKIISFPKSSRNVDNISICMDHFESLKITLWVLEVRHYFFETGFCLDLLK